MSMRHEGMLWVLYQLIFRWILSISVYKKSQLQLNKFFWYIMENLISLNC